MNIQYNEPDNQNWFDPRRTNMNWEEEKGDTREEKNHPKKVWVLSLHRSPWRPRRPNKELELHSR